LAKLPAWIARRREIAAVYDRAFADMTGVMPLRVRPEVGHAYHLYAVQLQLERLNADRAHIFAALRAENIGVNVHYIPVHLHPFYRQRFGTGPGDCPVAERAYDRLLTIPLFPAMTDNDAADVVTALAKVIGAYRK
jgi:perosamine synthetase